MLRYLPILLLLCVFSAPAAHSHCQIPCGIYGDQRRFDDLAEDLATIEKAMKNINELARSRANYNQLVRWVTAKEEHARKIQQTLLDYFLAQRIKVPAKGAKKGATAKYRKHLVLVHQMIVRAMKCKQTTDIAHVGQLRDLLAQFHAAYFGKKGKQHLKAHHEKPKKVTPKKPIPHQELVDKTKALYRAGKKIEAARQVMEILGKMKEHSWAKMMRLRMIRDVSLQHAIIVQLHNDGTITRQEFVKKGSWLLEYLAVVAPGHKKAEEIKQSIADAEKPKKKKTKKGDPKKGGK